MTSANGIFVLDIDCKKGAGGFESLKRLMDKYGDLPETPTQRTPSGGYHLLFQYPHDCVIRNSSSQIGQGLDVRGLNGFIVVAPSQLSEGKYEWLTNRSIFDLPPAIAPKWLLQLIQNPPQEGEITQWLSVGSNRQKIREGEGRNQALISFAGSLRARNVEERAMLEMLHTYNVAHFDPPLDDDAMSRNWTEKTEKLSG